MSHGKIIPVIRTLADDYYYVGEFDDAATAQIAIDKQLSALEEQNIDVEEWVEDVNGLINPIHRLIAAADFAYGDNLVSAAFTRAGHREVSDTLARFIAIELEETFEGDVPNGLTQDDIDRACQVMQKAVYELNSVIRRLAHLTPDDAS